MADEVLRERRGHVEILTINRPEARNAINGAVSAGLAAALDEVEDDSDVWVVVLTGSGDKAFSAGMDLKAFAAGEGASVMGAPGGFAGIARRELGKPLIAAVNGSALAGGLEVALSCDLIVAADHAVFGIPEASRGLIAGAGALFRLPRRVPLAVALEMALTGDPIDAERALQLGLVNRVVARHQLMDETLVLAERIAENAPLAVRYSKSVMLSCLGADDATGWRRTDEAVSVVFSSSDAMEGPVAFAEKRRPNWQGR